MYEKFAKLSDADWLATLKRSITEPVIDGVKFPGFPAEAIQVNFTSHKNEAALDEAFTFFQIAKNSCGKYAKPMGRDTRYLDFGVGWARIVRMFLKDIDPKNIHGVDVTPEILSECQKLMPVGDFKLCKPRGSIDYPDGAFDLVTAFSVFSHLSADNGKHWLREIHRVLRPGGLAVVTTLSKSFLSICLEVSNNPTRSDWHKGMAESVARAYPNWKKVLPNFPKDQLLYLPSGGGFDSLGSADYGWAMVSETYARKEWAPWFEVVEFVDDPKVFAQAHMTLKRK